jgi:glycine/D-amino acid oxidase-like deaminating enzyme
MKGEPDKTDPLPATADEVAVDQSQCDDLIAYIGTISPALASAPIKARQACYLPQHIRFGEQRGPLIGPTSVPGLWVAAGHTCWGIQNGPGTGYLMAGMLFGDEVDEAVGKLDPRKFKV